jgi:hypothetical protein
MEGVLLEAVQLDLSPRIRSSPAPGFGRISLAETDHVTHIDPLPVPHKARGFARRLDGRTESEQVPPDD